MTSTDEEIPSRLPPSAIGRAMFNAPSRPMLARDADSMYWMSRYVERAEHIARLLLVNTNLLVDVGDLAATLEESQWQSVLSIMHLPPLRSDTDDDSAPDEDAQPGETAHPARHKRAHISPADDRPISARIAQYMTFDADNPNSILSCLSRARENARGIRENISAEMWENLNTLYWSIRGDDAAAKFEESPDDFYRSIMTGSMLFQGLSDQTMAHDQRWLFTQVAKYFERIDVTSRVIETKFNILRSAEMFLESPIRNIHWMAVLRSCCSIEAYRRHYLGDMDPNRVVGFLILERQFPRSIRFSVAAARHAIAEIRSGINPTGFDAAERIIGRLDAQLEYAEMSEILEEGLPQYLQNIQTHIADAALAVQKAYFLH